MAIERHVEGTGIYRTTRQTGTTLADLQTLAVQHSEAMRQRKASWLADLEAILRRYLDDKDTCATIRSDAEAAWATLGMAKAAIRQGAACTVESAYWFYELGRLAEKLAVRPAEPHALRGRKTLAAAQKAHVTTHGTADTKAARRAAVLAAWDRERASHHGWSVAAIDLLVGKQFKCSDRTVRTYRRQVRKVPPLSTNP